MVCGWEGDVCLSVAHGQKVTSPSVTWFEHGRLEESENVGNVLSVNAFFVNAFSVAIAAPRTTNEIISTWTCDCKFRTMSPS